MAERSGNYEFCISSGGDLLCVQPQRRPDAAHGIFDSVPLKEALRTLLGEPLPTFTPVRP